jgi:hypothetical protein
MRSAFRRIRVGTLALAFSYAAAYSLLRVLGVFVYTPRTAVFTAQPRFHSQPAVTACVIATAQITPSSPESLLSDSVTAVFRPAMITEISLRELVE